VVLQALGWAIRAWLGAARRAARYRQRREDFHQRVAATLRRARARGAHLAWQGLRPFRVAAIVDEAADVKSFYLTPADGLRLPPFEPGQYLTFHLKCPGDEKPVVRCYSLSERPREDYYRCTIKRQDVPRDRPDLPAGRASSMLHRHVRVGDLVEVQAPRGEFFLDPLDDHPIVLIGGGIGVTPLVSMLNAMIAGERQHDVYFFLGVQNSQHHPFREHLVQTAARNESVHLQVSYSRPLDSDRAGIDYHTHGRITIDRLRQSLPSNNFRFYVCGPGGMMESIVPALLDWGVPAEHINYEAFGPATVKSISHTQSPAVGPREPCEVS
jgi:ferredoxin-NADP reductase